MAEINPYDALDSSETEINPYDALDSSETEPLTEGTVFKSNEESDPNSFWKLALRSGLDPFRLFGTPVQQPDYDPTVSEGVSQEAFEGVASGLSKIVQGVGETVALVPDIAFGTEYGSAITDLGESFRKAAGIDPVGVTGVVTDVGAQFVLPGGLAAKIATGGPKAVSLIDKAIKVLKGVGAATVADSIVWTDKTPTVGDAIPDDWWGGEITNSIEDIGLTGRQEAFRRGKNKIIGGVEAALAQLIIPAALTATGKVASKTALGLDKVPLAKYVGPVKIAQGVSKAKQTVVDPYLQRIELNKQLGIKQPFVSSLLINVIKPLRYRGLLPEQIAAERSIVGGVVEAEVKTAEGLASRVDKALLKVSKRLDKRLPKVVDTLEKSFPKATPSTHVKFMNSLNEYLTGSDELADTYLQQLPKSVHTDLKWMKSQLKELQEGTLKSDFIDQSGTVLLKGADQTLRETLESNLGKFLRTRYKIYTDKAYKPSASTLKMAKDGFARDAEAVQKELDDLYNFDKSGQSSLTVSDYTVTGGKPTSKQIQVATDNFLERHKRANSGGAQSRFGGRVPDEKLDMGLFTPKKNIEPYQKALLGEVKNPLERYVATVADIAQFNATDAYFGAIRALADNGQHPGIANLFRNTEGMSVQDIKSLTDRGFVVLGKSSDDATNIAKAKQDGIDIDEDAAFLDQFTGGTGEVSSKGGTATEGTLSSGWGTLNGYAVPKNIYNDLTRTVKEQNGDFVDIARNMYGGFLKAKAATQYGKTILSPPTQIRNVTTAAFFALVNGNLGKGANLLESMQTVYNSLGNLGQEAQVKKFNKYQRLGVVGSQSQLRELKQLISEGMGYYEQKGGKTKAFGSDPDQTVLQAFSKKLVSPIKGGLKSAENLYQAGDDIWKIYAFEFERNKLLNALRDTPFLDKLARLPLNRQFKALNTSLGKETDLRGFEALDAQQSSDVINDLITQKELLNLKESAEYLNTSLGNKMDLRGFDGFEVAQKRNIVEQLLDEESASIVRNTVPNYNMAPQAIQFLRKTPVGSFTSFPYEIMRTGSNITARGVTELASTNPRIQAIGLRRLTGLLSAVYIVPETMVRTARRVTGVTKEEEDAYRRSIGPKYSRYDQHMSTGRDKNKIPQFVNLSYSMPYDQLRRTVVSVFDNIEEGRLNKDSPATIVKDATFGALAELYKPFLGESIALEAFRDVVAVPSDTNPISIVGGRGGKTPSGAEVYDREDSLGDQIVKSTKHLIGTIAPNILPVQVKGGEFVPSRFAQGVINKIMGPEYSIQDRQGRVRHLSQELSRIFSGVSQVDTSQINKSYQYKGKDFATRKNNASTQFNSVARRPNVTKAQLLEAYTDANNARRNVMEEFFILSTDAETIGISKRKQINLLKEGRVSGFDEAVFGKYKPYEINKGTIKTMVKNNTVKLLPLAEIRKIQLRENRLKLGVPVVKEYSPSNVNPVEVNPFDQFDNPVEVNPFDQFDKEESSNFAPPAVTPPPNIQVSQASSVPLSPSLLGDSRNIDIANRLGRA
jgi:hypothetical protein